LLIPYFILIETKIKWRAYSKLNHHISTGLMNTRLIRNPVNELEQEHDPIIELQKQKNVVEKKEVKIP
jgi:hypothetical protein